MSTSICFSTRYIYYTVGPRQREETNNFISYNEAIANIWKKVCTLLDGRS